MSFWSFVEGLFSRPKKVVLQPLPNMADAKPAVQAPKPDPEAPSCLVRRVEIVDEIIRTAMTFVGERETEGNNRSPFLDKMIPEEGGSLGEPYCAYGVMHVNRLVKQKLGLQSSLFQTGCSQALWNETPVKFKVGAPLPGYLGVFRDRANPVCGHVVIATSSLASDGKTFTTIEFNTNGDGSRDGDGVYSRHRTTDGTHGLELRGFIKWPEMFT